MSPWRHPVLWMRAHQRAVDVGLAAVLTILAWVSLAVSHGHLPKDVREPTALAYALVPLATVPLAWRRQRPIAVLVVTLAAVIASQSQHFPEVPSTVAPAVAAYSVGAYVASRRAVRVTAVALVGGLVLLTLIDAIRRHKVSSLVDALGNTVFLGAALLLGDNVRRRRERLADLEARATAEDAARDLRAREAVAAERQRIARELHDVVAHSLSVMVVQAGAARRMVATKPDQATDALATIESTGRDALDEMRRLLGVLRTPTGTAELTPQPSLAALSALASADPDLRVDVRVEGEPVPVPAVVDLQAYRIVQEALTNVRKHAGPARATVRVRYGADSLEVHVDDDGRGASAASGSGHGLLGMRERAALCGGELRAGPRAGGGWSVTARLPLRPLGAAAS